MLTHSRFSLLRLTCIAGATALSACAEISWQNTYPMSYEQHERAEAAVDAQALDRWQMTPSAQDEDAAISKVLAESPTVAEVQALLRRARGTATFADAATASPNNQ